MRRSAIVLAIGLSALAGACEQPEPTAVLPLYDATPAMGIAANGGHAAVPLTGTEEVPARETRARGTAIFQLSDDGLSMSYQLIVANIENVIASHIHLGSAGENGPVVVFLYGTVPAGGGRTDGVLAEGTFTASNFVGPLAGQTMEDLVAAMQAGGAYVNVHTNDGVTPTNTGPGDFPGGEVRGQVR